MVKGTNNLDVRVNNRKNIVQMLYRNGMMTKQDIANTLELSLPTVSVILKELTDAGLVTIGGSLESSGGRRPTLNKLVLDARCAVGLSISRQHIRIQLVNLGLEIKATYKERIPFSDTPKYWDHLQAVVGNFILDNHFNDERLLGIGVSVPGVLQRDGKILDFAPTLGVNGLDLDKIRALFDHDVMIANDAKLAGLSHIWRHDTDGGVFLLLNKGVGGAIINGKKLVSGTRSGEFGHMTLVDGGRPCDCGRSGCLEAYCSSTAITETSGMDLEDFFLALEKGDARAAAIWDEYLDHLSLGINNLRVIFDDQVIVGGEMGPHIRRYEEDLLARLRKRNPFHDDPADFLRISDYGEFDSVVGAAILQINKYLD